MIVKELGNLEQSVLSIAQPIIDGIYLSLPSTRKNELHKDARAAVFANLIQVLRTVKICNICKVEHLDDMDWYLNTYITKYEQQTSMLSPGGNQMTGVLGVKEVYKKDFSQVMLVALVQCSFSAVESSLRIFMRTIDSSVANNSTDDYINVYTPLLNRLSLNQHKDVLDLFRLIRNTIHNNGVYMHKKNPSEKVNYRGKEYVFTHMVAPNYGDAYDMMIMKLLPDIVDMLKDVCNSSRISAESFIEDLLWKSNPNP